jgi:CBS domain-containing protein
MELKIVLIEKRVGINFILGQSHFIKTIEDFHEAIVQTASQMKFGIAFCESSGPAVVRWSGNDGELLELAKANALAIAWRSLLHHLHQRWLSDQYPEHDQGRSRGVHDLLRDRKPGRRHRGRNRQRPRSPRGHRRHEEQRHRDRFGRCAGFATSCERTIGIWEWFLHASIPLYQEEESMKVREAMSSDVRIASPEQTVCEAACLMADIDAGALPVGENDRLVGMITDRDIAVRAVAQGRSPDTKIRDVMSKELLYCFEDEDLDKVAKQMSNLKIRRLPVLNRDKRLVGIVSMGDLALNEDSKTAGQTIAHLSEHGGPHSQTAH